LLKSSIFELSKSCFQKSVFFLSELTLAAMADQRNRQFIMTERTLIKNINIVNEGQINRIDILIDNEIIQKIGLHNDEIDEIVFDGTGKYRFPVSIDGQVYFCGLTQKGYLSTESIAAIAGRISSFIGFRYTALNVLTLDILKEKSRVTSEKSLANFGFFLGVNGNYIDEVIQLETPKFIGVSDDRCYFTKKGQA